MDQEDKERCDALAYDTHLESIISGLSIADLRSLSDKIIYRIQGLEEKPPLAPDVRANLHQFVKGVNGKFDAMHLPSEKEALYFLNKAKALIYDMEALVEDVNFVWSWLGEHEKRGRLSREHLQMLAALRWSMYYTAGLSDLRHFIQNLPRSPDEMNEEWIRDTSDEPGDDSYLEAYRASL